MERNTERNGNGQGLHREFARVFYEEHREIRDVLIALMRAFEARDRTRIARLLEETAALTGPHFRYEEESLYPALTAIFGDEYIDKLLGDHDGAIGAASKLVALAGKESLTDDDVATATRLVRGLLPHVSDCDGLSIMVELLDDGHVRRIFDARAQAYDAGLDLITWAGEVRGRPAAVLD